METVLIVDDNPDLLELLAEVLQTVGRFCIHTARSGLEALSVYDSVHPALVILDEGLGDIGGSELLRRLRAADASALKPALFLTGLRSSVKCLPGDVVLEKPVEMGQLIDAVESLVAAASRV